ncbi:Hypothetical protein BHY_1385 (plasmid) [Borrelia nietonii YOR]|uniref:Uncharacterized protein n=1 Tax=Borrelia nietonii YOR TaxID=1293576 RepID=W5SGU0_9SPIR|nr:DUF603 domain-containing protein [Borrelia nietonii]AHH04336.1 Hypothetical protein BHY_1385 [Borrelia nietonii YOR]UPA09952.1 DUF603 domain-containing protein [Borrelia nietonii YOR]
MRRVKKSFDDYVVYFKECRLNDAQIAKELGVSRVNVGEMRCKWEEVKDGPEYVKETAKLTIREDTFNNMLARRNSRNIAEVWEAYKSMNGLKRKDFDFK